jgi:hypothetical protein
LPQSRRRRVSECDGDCPFQSAHPRVESKSQSALNEQMHVIRQNDIAAYCHVKLIFGSTGIAQKDFMHFVEALDLKAMNRAEGNEEERRFVAGKNSIQSRGTSFDHVPSVAAAMSAAQFQNYPRSYAVGGYLLAGDTPAATPRAASASK